MKSIYQKAMFVLLTIFAFTAFASPNAEAKKFKVGVSIYVGWMPWYYSKTVGTINHWAQKYGHEIEIVTFGDYIASIEAFVAGQIDACAMTNLEALNMPAAGGIDCTMVIMGDYSDDNDVVLTRDKLGIKDLAGHDAYLVQYSVSHYLLARGLSMNNIPESSVRVKNMSDSDIGAIFASNPEQKVTVTWNPIAMSLMQAPGITKVFGSSQIPGEILDLMIVNTKTLEANPGFGKALVGAWYEVMDIMTSRTQASQDAIARMANESNCTQTEFKSQLRTTAMFYSAKNAVAYTSSGEIKEKMDLVRRFCASQGLLGEGVADPDVVGIEFPDGTVLGNKNNIKLRFATKYMQMAADGEL